MFIVVMEVEKISFDETVVEGDFMSHQSLLSWTVKDTNITAMEKLDWEWLHIIQNKTWFKICSFLSNTVN